MNVTPELNVTLSEELLEHLRAESQRLEVPLEWLVASLVVDTLDEVRAGSTSSAWSEPQANRSRVWDWEPALAG